MPTLLDLVPALTTGDTSQPAITCYDRTGGQDDGERIELSARVLMTWASKAANALQDELLLEPGGTVGLVLPPHWRAGVWALATWWLGGTLVTGDAAADADVLVTDSPTLAGERSGDTVLVTLAGLARRHPGPVPSGVMDEAAELSSYGDRFDPLSAPSPGDLAWVRGRERVRYDGSVVARPGRTALVADSDSAELLDRALVASVESWLGRGGLVLVRTGGLDLDLSGLLTAEQVVSTL